MVKIIAIDGPASVGKSTLAKKISKKFNAPVLYSGKLYRALALEAIKRKINFNKTEEILKCITYIDLDNLESAGLYSSEVDNVSSSKPQSKGRPVARGVAHSNFEFWVLIESELYE